MKFWRLRRDLYRGAGDAQAIEKGPSAIVKGIGAALALAYHRAVAAKGLGVNCCSGRRAEPNGRISRRA